MEFTMTRLAALVFTIFATQLTIQLGAGGGNRDLYYLVFHGFGITHYALSYVYGARRIRGLAAAPTTWLPLAGVLLVTTAVLLLDYPGQVKLFAWFALHHAFNESYLLHGRQSARSNVPLTTAGSFFHLAAYLAILSQGGLGRLIAPPTLGAIALVSAVVYGATIVRASRRGADGESVRAAWLDLGFASALSAAAVTGLVRIVLFDVVFYHFAFWLVWPLWQLSRRPGHASLGYLGATAALWSGLLVCASIVPGGSRVLAQWFLVLSYVHIGTAFALSSSNPRWISRWFAPEPRQVAAATLSRA